MFVIQLQGSQQKIDIYAGSTEGRNLKKASREHKPGVTVHIYDPSTQETKQKHKVKACLGKLDPVSKKN